MDASCGEAPSQAGLPSTPLPFHEGLHLVLPYMHSTPAPQAGQGAHIDSMLSSTSSETPTFTHHLNALPPQPLDVRLPARGVDKEIMCEVDAYAELLAEQRSVVQPALLDELRAAQDERERHDAHWDTTAGNALVVLELAAASQDMYALFHATGDELDTLVLRVDPSLHGAGSVHTTHHLPRGRRVRQVRCARASQTSFHLVARAMYWAHFYRGSVESSVYDVQLEPLGDITYSARPLHVCFNQRRAGEVSALLESGHVIVSEIGTARLDGGKGPKAEELQACGVFEASSGLAVSSRSAPGLPWQQPLSRWRPPKNPKACWGAVEYGEHPCSLVAASNSTLFHCDLRDRAHGRAEPLYDVQSLRTCGLFRGVFSAFAVLEPHSQRIHNNECAHFTCSCAALCSNFSQMKVN